MSGVRGDLIGIYFVFGKIGLWSWCCHGFVVCVGWPGIFH